MGNRAPNDEAQIDLFLALVEDYRELAERLPASTAMTLGGQRDPQDHWHRLLRAFALRKFISKTDSVYLPKVAKSLQALLPEDQQGDGHFEEGMTKIVDELLEGNGAYGTGQERAHLIVLDDLYGRYLHGDYDKWQRTMSRGNDLTREVALWEWVTHIEEFVFKLAAELHDLREDGTLPTASEDRPAT